MIKAEQAAEMLPEFLSAVELHALTGYARPGQQAQGFTHPDGHVLPRDCRANIRAAIRPTNGLKARCAEGAV